MKPTGRKAIKLTGVHQGAQDTVLKAASWFAIDAIIAIEPSIIGQPFNGVAHAALLIAESNKGTAWFHVVESPEAIAAIVFPHALKVKP